MSGKDPESARHPPSRHPRPSEQGYVWMQFVCSSTVGSLLLTVELLCAQFFWFYRVVAKRTFQKSPWSWIPFCGGPSGPCLMIVGAPCSPPSPEKIKVTQKWLKSDSTKVTKKWLSSHFGGIPQKSLLSHFWVTLIFSGLGGAVGGSHDHNPCRGKRFRRFRFREKRFRCFASWAQPRSSEKRWEGWNISFHSKAALCTVRSG